MKPFQKVIKYGAMAFAIYLAVMIISMIVFGVTAIFGIGVGIEAISNNVGSNTDNSELLTYTEEYIGVESLDIDLSKSSLEIRNGDSFKVEFVNVSKDLFTKLNDSTKELKIEDKPLKLFENVNSNSKVILYIPSDYELKNIKLDLVGVSESYIEGFKAEKLEIDIGAGKYEINNVIVTNADIESGAGETIVKNSTFGNFEFNGGVGKAIINCKISNRGEIEAGVGKLEVNLIGSKDDYKICPKTGVGNLTIDRSKVKSGDIIGTGNINVNIEAGIGETSINFVEEDV